MHIHRQMAMIADTVKMLLRQLFSQSCKNVVEINKQYELSTILQANAGAGYATLSMAYVAVKFADACLQGLRGDANVIRCAFVDFVEPKLFRMDVRSNISYGCTRDVTQEDIEQAAKQAYAHDFVSSLPDGYKTIVDDDLLSGEQKQRIAIARALLRNLSILILGEATSTLDAESEYNIKGVLSAAGENFKRTVIIIAHRLSTVQTADRIVIMDRGQVIEVHTMGNHRELLLKDGLYAQLTRRQVNAVG